MTDIPDDEKTSRLHNALALEELVAANSESNKTMLSLVEHMRKETAARDRKIETLAENTTQMKRLSFAVIGAVAILLLIASVNAFNLNSQRQTSEQVSRTNELLLDCVNATGTCGQINAENQRKILDEVKKYEVTGFYCIRTNPADRDPKGEAFLDCMNRLYPGGPQLEGR